MEVEFEIKCLRCGSVYPGKYWYWKCEKCGGALEIELKLDFKAGIGDLIDGKSHSMWRYGKLIPVSSRFRVSIGEGMTPLITRVISGINVLFKLEYLNPTGSFKDRGASAVITRALELGAERVVEDSSGNAGLSIAAYASAANLRAKIYVPKGAPEGKKSLIKLLGGELVEAGSRVEAARRAVNELEPDDYYVGHSWNPFFIEGIKTIAHEVAEQCNWRIPQSIVVPVGNGTLLLGLYKGFKELLDLSAIDWMPRLIAVQAAGYAPLYESIYGGVEWRSRAELADAIKIKNPPRLEQMRRVIEETDGDVVVVEDHEIVGGLKTLLKMGLIVEPTSAAALAALMKIRGEIDGIACIPLTGSGIKMASRLLSLLHAT